MLRNFPRHFRAFICGSDEIPAKFPPQNSKKKITDELPQERREKQWHTFFQCLSPYLALDFLVWISWLVSLKEISLNLWGLCHFPRVLWLGSLVTRFNGLNATLAPRYEPVYDRSATVRPYLEPQLAFTCRQELATASLMFAAQKAQLHNRGATAETS